MNEPGTTADPRVGADPDRADGANPPMTIEDALLYLEEKRLPLVAFREAKTGQVCVVYKEGPMNYALVETGKG